MYGDFAFNEYIIIEFKNKILIFIIKKIPYQPYYKLQYEKYYFYFNQYILIILNII